MARKNLLAGLMDGSAKPAPADDAAAAPRREELAPSFKSKGALGAVTRSIDALAARAAAAKDIEDRLTAGEVIVALDPALVEDSFIADRLRLDDEAFDELVEAIRARGQDSPILVRPHPDQAGHYQVAFGHRRLRAAKLLGIPVRAVVKQLADKDHVIAQGQENSARADLSFIERTMFATRLDQAGFDRETIMSALSADKTTVSKMLSVTKRIPAAILDTLLTAHSVGRDRWHDFSARMEDADFAEAAAVLTRTADYSTADGEGRFEQLEKLNVSLVTEAKKPASAAPVVRNWKSKSGDVAAKIRADAKGFTLSLKARRAAAFGAYLESNLDRLYEAFEAQKKNDGD